MDSSSLAHCKWECQYHIIFIPKFRRKKLYGMVKDDVRDIIKTLCCVVTRKWRLLQVRFAQIMCIYV